MRSEPFHLRKNLFQFAIPHKWVAAYQGNMQWAMFLHNGHHAPHQFVTFEVGKLPKHSPIAEMRVIKRVASRATQRALFCDFNG